MQDQDARFPCPAQHSVCSLPGCINSMEWWLLSETITPGSAAAGRAGAPPRAGARTAGNKGGLPDKVARAPSPGLDLPRLHIYPAQGLLGAVLAGVQRQARVHVPVSHACHSTAGC